MNKHYYVNDYGDIMTLMKKVFGKELLKVDINIEEHLLMLLLFGRYEIKKF
jgi:hypothetical protein